MMYRIARPIPATLRITRLQPVVARQFSYALISRKTTTDTVKKAAETVNQAAGNAAVKGIELGETVVDTTKKAAGVASGKAKYTTESAKEKADRAKNETEERYEQAKQAGKENVESAKRHIDPN